jgi:hypothetical protein
MQDARQVFFAQLLRRGFLCHEPSFGKVRVITTGPSGFLPWLKKIPRCFLSCFTVAAKGENLYPTRSQTHRFFFRATSYRYGYAPARPYLFSPSPLSQAFFSKQPHF